MKKTYQDTTIGYFYAFSALIFWGLLPIYWAQLTLVPPIMVVAHRTIWAALTMFILMVFSRKLKSFLVAICQPKVVLMLAIATCILASNWFIFIQAIGVKKVLETSLGYYISPLITIVFGVVFFKETLRPLQILAIVIASIAVLYQALMLQALPYYALALCITFSIYSAVKKSVRLDGLVSLTIESMILSPFMLIYLLFFNAAPVFNGSDWMHTLLLVGSGLATALPLVWFSNAARKLPLTTLGFLNFLSPTISLGLAVFYFNEKFTQIHFVTFIFIGAALCLYAFDMIQHKADK